MQQLLKKLIKTALDEIQTAQTVERLYTVEIKYLGRKGEFTALMKGLKDVPKKERANMGKMCNEAKNKLTAAFEKHKRNLKKQELASKLNMEFFDTSAPGKTFDMGNIHPISQVQREVETIFNQMGFTVMDGPEVESEYYNFEGLNIPGDHPARDMQDTFFVKNKFHKEKHGRMVLRTHTSPTGQCRALEKYGAPLRVITPGRTFRYEATDASHDSTFYQVEGLLIDKGISLAHLKGVMTEFLARLFRKEMKIRFRPGYFPFVEPGVELDMSCIFCENGCRVCKKTGWIEFMGAGMTHPNVLEAAGVDSNKYQGWAFGFGLTRLVMMRYAIDDIRLLTSGDLRFLNQF